MPKNTLSEERDEFTFIYSELFDNEMLIINLKIEI